MPENKKEEKKTEIKIILKNQIIGYSVWSSSNSSEPFDCKGAAYLDEHGNLYYLNSKAVFYAADPSWCIRCDIYTQRK